MYDIIIIGAGPGGYVAAERAGSMGKKVLIIEQEKLGGVCLNWGCIPTKSLLHSAKLYQQAKHSEQFGVVTSDVSFDFEKAMKWKKKTVDSLVAGIGYLMKMNHVEVVFGHAEIESAGRVRVNDTVYEAPAIIIATGSSPAGLPIPGADLEHVVTNRGALSLDSLPKRIAIIGGGVIGIEFASLFSSLDAEVTVLEMMPEILPMMDSEITKTLKRQMKGVRFFTNSRVSEITETSIVYDCNGEVGQIDSNLVLMAVGRKPNSSDLGIEALGIDHNHGSILVNEQLQTNVPGIYAIGDVTGKSLLAHSASRMGEVAVNTICGIEDRMDYKAIPWAVYTYPEAAGCGLTESEAKDQGYDVKIKKFNFAANGRFIAENGKKQGLSKIILNNENDQVLGMHLLGPSSSEMIFGAAILMEAKLKSSDIKKMVFPHPTISEVIRESFFVD